MRRQRCSAACARAAASAAVSLSCRDSAASVASRYTLQVPARGSGTTCTSSRGSGVHMIDGKMQDDATWKQSKVMVDLAQMLAEKDPELAEAYGFSGHH